ncbi:hypothetical protein C8R43DRAFT_1125888 [Mycena crocata]|nr:hypothetical protein C8R43DRAFT_1125888 [Mycena crocata]
MNPDSDMTTWTELLVWLDLPSAVLVEPRDTDAGRGLFATTSIPPSTPLFTIPARCLLNSRSLASHYPPGLDAVQLIALHLCLYRPSNSSHSRDPLFGPYISSLPREFDRHPLTSHVQAADTSELPPSVASALVGLHARYLHDWNAVRGYVQVNLRVLSRKPDVHLDPADDVLREDFLWVNTRCIYHRLKSKRSHPDNLTLCPILDFANHTVTGPCMKPQDGRAEVDVQDIVEGLFKDNGSDGQIKQKMLQDAGYWGDWSLDGSPAVSYRLITALRLLHVSLGSSGDILQHWRDTLTGLRDVVSDANESAWKESLVAICSSVIQRAKSRRNRSPTTGWISGDVDKLWEEELYVAIRVSSMYN